MNADWKRTVEKAKDEIPRLAARLRYAGSGTGDPMVILGKRIQIYEDILRWWDRCPNECFLMGVPKKSDLERQLAELRKEVSDMKRRTGR